MNFSFDDLGNKVNRALHTVVKKTNKAVKTAKISYNLSEVQNDLDRAYAALGKKIYDNLDNLDELNIEDDKYIISQLKEKLDAEKDRLSAVKDKKRCTNCDAEIDNNSAYCDKCGFKID